MPFGSWPLLVRPVRSPSLVYIIWRILLENEVLRILGGSSHVSVCLAQTTPLQLDTWHINEAQAQITLLISSTQAEPRCPECDVPARRVHRDDTRTLADLPWSDDRITWQLRVRTLCCRHTICPRRIFTERLPGLVAPWARRTVRLAAHLLAIGLALGGAAESRLSCS
jgi:hypothetical protein